MNRNQCSEIQPLLVDFADDELCGDEQTLVRAHVAECKNCQFELQRLQTSMAMLRRYWEQLSPDVVPGSLKTRIARVSILRHAAVGVAVAAALLVVGLVTMQNRWTSSHYSGSRELVRENGGSPHTQVDVPGGHERWESQDVVELVFHESQTARLRATMSILESQPSLALEAERIRDQLDTGYPAFLRGQLE